MTMSSAEGRVIEDRMGVPVSQPMLATIERIDSVKAHPNADRLDIVGVGFDIASGTCLIELPEHGFKRWTRHGLPGAIRSNGRVPRDPAAKGQDKPPKPGSPQATGCPAGPS